MRTLVAALSVILASWAPAGAVECFTPARWQPKLMQTVMDENGNFLHDSLDALDPRYIVDVVVDLNRCADDVDLARLAAFGDIALAGEVVSFVVLERVAVARLAELVADPQVAFVEAEPATSPMLDVSRQVVRADQVQMSYGYDGTGVHIAILDTGVDDGTHVGLPASAYVGGVDCSITPPSCVLSANPDDLASFGSHGTSVAGVALGRGGGDCPGCVGVAPRAGLVDVKVFGPQLPILPAVLGGMHAVIQDKQQLGIDVVNMSFANCLATDGTDIFSVLANEMVKRGMVAVTSVGNTVNCQNIPNPNANVIPAPAGADDVIAVANAFDMNTLTLADDMIWWSSLTGPRIPDADLDTLDERKPELAAPGTLILTAQADSLVNYGLHTGTSLSAPHVAGCAALVLQAQPGMPPLAVKKLLLDESRDMGAPGWDGFWGNGMLDCMAAIDRLEQQEKTDLLFEVWDCRPGSPPCWTTPNLYAVDPTIEENEPNLVVAEVSNNGPATASNFLVKLGVYNFGNGNQDYHLCTVPVVGPLLAGHSIDVSCPYTPQLTGGGSYVQASLKAEIIYPFDADFSNNRARRDVQIGQITISLALPMELVNFTDLPQTIRLDVAEACCVNPGGPGGSCACPGWAFRSSFDQIDLAPDDCSVPVMLELEAVDPDALREARFDVTIVGTDPAGSQTMLNGVTVGARLDCAPGPPQWLDKVTLTWTGSSFRTCGDVYDVARGPLPIVNGDLSTADCIADDQAEGLWPADEIPGPGTGFYYLFRMGGPEPGTWNDGGEAEDRDPKLAACS